MAKKENFGIVSVNYLSKVCALSFLLFGCSAQTISSVEAEKLWQKQFDYCHEIAQQNKSSFPKSEWFQSLSLDDKKTVVGYLANYTDRICMEEASAQLKRSLSEENNLEKLSYYSVDLTPLDELAAERIAHLDGNQLKDLQQQFKQPFNLRFIIEEQNLYPSQ
ncbi:hypothetical protein [uncultured Photobacterium sp.]|uniref:hypothetical protein n=1 Tax=uncultured Photobacterium sp. TaxID=173973 RepID=UPI002624BD01|nr:hypothetical protein [uncultured Photobacterium sp.]